MAFWFFERSDLRFVDFFYSSGGCSVFLASLGNEEAMKRILKN